MYRNISTVQGHIMNILSYVIDYRSKHFDIDLNEFISDNIVLLKK